MAGGTDLFAPLEPGFQSWLQRVPLPTRARARRWYTDLPPRLVPHPMLVPAPVEGRNGIVYALPLLSAPLLRLYQSFDCGDRKYDLRPAVV